MPQFTVFKGSKDGSIVKSTTTKELNYDEVLIKVTYSGVCGTDEHQRHKDIGLGHEGVGTVEVNHFMPLFHPKAKLTKKQEVGASVKTLRKGDSVGWGYQHNSCGHCKHCLTGHETRCAEAALYGSAE